MDKKVEEAVAKLKKESEAASANSYVRYVGDYMIGYIQGNPQYAGYVLAKDKTVKGSMDHMRGIAKKKAKSGMAFLTPDEGFDAVLEYYGISDAKPVLVAVNEKKKVDISLDDMLM